MRAKFKIMYPKTHPDPNKAGKPFLAKKPNMVVMNGQGIFFVFNGETYYPSIKPLSDVLPYYDVVWK